MPCKMPCKMPNSYSLFCLHAFPSPFPSLPLPLPVLDPISLSCAHWQPCCFADSSTVR
jgi:hypothetical protein